jgi:hypothetical protein
VDGGGDPHVLQGRMIATLDAMHAASEAPGAAVA